MRAKIRGSFARKVTSSAISPPAGTGSGSGTRQTVRSSALPSSGCSKVAPGARSLPSARRMDRTSTKPQPSSAMRSPRSWPPDSTKNVLFELLNAFRYRWNHSSPTGSGEGLRQTMRSSPSSVFASGSRRTRMS